MNTDSTSKPFAARVDFRLVLEIGQLARQMTGERLAAHFAIVAQVKPVQAAEQREQRLGHFAAKVVSLAACDGEPLGQREQRTDNKR